MKVPFFMHDVGEEELALLSEVIKSPIISTGDLVSEFESEFSKYLGTSATVATNSCTGALHLGMVCLGIGQGDEVIVPALTFVASSEAIINTGAKPIFADVLYEDGNLDPDQVVKYITPKTKAILVVHLYGKMVDMKRFREIADEFGLYLIEDAAHCVEGERDGVSVGKLSDFAAFSFFATKNMTCGEGGAFSTNNTELAQNFKTRSLHGMTKTANDRYKEGFKQWDVIDSGWKYNLSNIQAAFLLPQLRKLKQKHEKRVHLANRYIELLSGNSNIRIPSAGASVKHARHLLPVWLNEASREDFMAYLKDSGVVSTVNYNPVHLLTYYRKRFGYKEGDFPVAEEIGKSTVSLPFYPSMPVEHVVYVSEAVNSFFNQ